jgi:hypothetical protein
MSSKQTSGNEGNVMVVCRFRPFNQNEIAMGTKGCAEFAKDQQHVTIKTVVSKILNKNWLGKLAANFYV